MRKSRYSDQQIALPVQHVEHGASVADICRKLGIREQTFYRWKRKFGGMAPKASQQSAARSSRAMRAFGLRRSRVNDRWNMHIESFNDR